MPLDEATLESFPEEIRADPGLQSFNDVGSIAKSYLETKRMVGDSIRMPAKDVSAEDAQKWWQDTAPKLAERGFLETKPASPENYEFNLNGTTPEVLKNDPLLKEYRTIAHSMGLSNKQANALLGEFGAKLLPKMMPAGPEVIEGEAVKAAIQEKFGSQSTKRLADYQSAMNTLKQQYPKLNDMLKESVGFYNGKAISFFDHPDMIEVFSDIGAKMAQDFGGAFGGIPEGETLETISEKIVNLRNDPNFQKLGEEAQGEKLLPLYKIKTAMLKRIEREQGRG